MPKKTVHVVPSPKGGWDVKSGVSHKTYRHFDRKTDAVDCGRNVSRNNKAEFYIHRQDGKIQSRVKEI